MTTISRFTRRTLPHRQFRICVDGLIGIGKTTMLKYLVALMKSDRTFDLPIHFFQAPVDKWMDSYGGIYPTLEDVYNNPDDKDLRVQFQLRVLNTFIERGEMMKHASGIVIEERSLLSVYSFIDVLEQERKMSIKTSLQMKNLINNISRSTRPSDMNFYLTLVDYDECLARIDRRKRPGEDTITETFLRSLYDKRVLNFMNDDIEIDASSSPENIAIEVLEKIKACMKHTCFGYNVY